MAGMLVSMQSIALSDAAAPPFNGLFYATMATVIPVLFVAAAVQGSTYQKMLKDSSRRYAVSIWQGNDLITLRKEVRRGSLTWPQALRKFADFRDLLSLAIASLYVAVALVTVVLATVAEVLSLLSLYNQRADSGSTILASGVLLTCMTAAGPAAAIARTTLDLVREEFRFYRGARPESSGESAAGSEPEAADDRDRPGESAPS
jgi:hypothetical protein